MLFSTLSIGFLWHLYYVAPCTFWNISLIFFSKFSFPFTCTLGDFLMYFQSFYWIFNFLILLVISKNSFLFSRVLFFFFFNSSLFLFHGFNIFFYFSKDINDNFWMFSLAYINCFLFQKIIFLFMSIPSFQFGVSIQISDDPFIFKGEAPKGCMQTRSAHGCDLWDH